MWTHTFHHTAHPNPKVDFMHLRVLLDHCDANLEV